MRVGQLSPLRSEECVQTIDRAIEEDCAKNHDQEQDNQQRKEDLVCCFNALGQATADDQKDEHPHECQRDHDGRNGAPREGFTINGLQEVIQEETLRVIAPRLVHRVDRVLNAPCDHGTVVHHNHEANQHLEPADELATGFQATQRPRR